MRVLHEEEDTWRWRVDQDGNYSVKSTYIALHDRVFANEVGTRYYGGQGLERKHGGCKNNRRQNLSHKINESIGKVLGRRRGVGSRHSTIEEDFLM